VTNIYNFPQICRLAGCEFPVFSLSTRTGASGTVFEYEYTRHSLTFDIFGVVQKKDLSIPWLVQKR